MQTRTRIKLEADYGQIKKRKNSPPATLLEVPSIGSSPAIVALEKTITAKGSGGCGPDRNVQASDSQWRRYAVAGTEGRSGPDHS